MQQGLTGILLIQRLNLYDDDIIDIVRTGLQPYGKNWKPILPPGGEAIRIEIAKLTMKMSIIENEFPGIQYSSYNKEEWHEIHVERKLISANGKLINKRYPDRTTFKIRCRYDNLEARVNKLEKKISWKHYRLPKQNNEIESVVELLLDARYKIEDVIELENRLEGEKQNPDLSLPETDLKTIDKIKIINKQVSQPEAVNFITRETPRLWTIGFEGVRAQIDHLDGIYYIAVLLSAKGASISCIDLNRSFTVKMSSYVVSVGAAIGEGLHTDHKKQAINSQETKEEYRRRHQKLNNELLMLNDLSDNDRTPETEMQKQEIENEMEAIRRCMDERTFADPDIKKAQANIHNRLNAAYKSINKVGMKNLEKHLRTHIKTDKAYGQLYTGDLAWCITI